MGTKRGFTLIELLVVIAIIALLVSILMPSLQKAKELAKDVVCMTNQRNVGLGFRYYAEDFDDQLPTNTFTGSPGFWAFCWDMRIGRIPENALPTSHPWFLLPGTPQNRIATTGYVDYIWDKWEGDSFKCPTYWDQFAPKSRPEDWNETQSHHFSVNGALLPHWVDPDDEGTLRCMRFSDIEINVMLLGDCHVSPLPYGTMPHYRYFYKQVKDHYYEYDIKRRGPWTFVDRVEVRYPSTYWISVDFYGHSGQKTNMYFVDGHVEGIKDLKASHFNIH